MKRADRDFRGGPALLPAERRAATGEPLFDGGPAASAPFVKPQGAERRGGKEETAACAAPRPAAAEDRLVHLAHPSHRGTAGCGAPLAMIPADERVECVVCADLRGRCPFA